MNGGDYERRQSRPTTYELHALLDAYADESGAVAPDDGIRRVQCARRVFVALRSVLDSIDLADELMSNASVVAVPASVLRSVIKRALEDK